MDEPDLHAFEEEIRGCSRWLSTSDRGAVLVVEVVDAFEILNRAVAAAVDAERARCVAVVEEMAAAWRETGDPETWPSCVCDDVVEALRVAARSTNAGVEM